MEFPIPSAAAIDAIAPNGTLRAAINLSNPLLVTGRSTSGDPTGIAPDVAATLASTIGTGIELVSYPSPAAIADSGDLDEWDVCCIGADPLRSATIAFTTAYSEIASTYLVGPESSARNVADIDQPGVRIASASRSAYDLWLERNLEHADLVPAEGLDGSFDVFVDQKLDALAGLLPRLLADVQRIPGARIVDGQFTAVQQAIGTPRARNSTGAQFLQSFVAAAIASGLVADLIATHEVTGLSVAPLP